MTDTVKTKWLIQSVISEECERVSVLGVIDAKKDEAKAFIAAKAKEIALDNLKMGYHFDDIDDDACPNFDVSDDMNCVVCFRDFHFAVLAIDLNVLGRTDIIEGPALQDAVNQAGEKLAEFYCGRT